MNVAKDIGEDCIKFFENNFSAHPRIQNILKHSRFGDKPFSFKRVDVKDIFQTYFWP